MLFGLGSSRLLVLVLYLAFWMGHMVCDPSFCIVWFRFRLFRRYLSFRADEVARLYRLLDLVHDGCSGHGPIHALVASAHRIGFSWDSLSYD